MGAVRLLFLCGGFEPERRDAADIVRRGDQWSPEELQKNACILFRFGAIVSMYIGFLDSSMVEHPAVNRVVAGSSPARGAHFRRKPFGTSVY